jgi:hypothetical protein
MKRHYNGERGSALIYILIAIALLAALTVAFMEPSSQQGTSQNTFKTVSEISSQVEFIRSAVQECVLSFPAGDDDISTNATAPAEPNANEAYPINPMSGRYSGATIPSAANRNVSGLRCPGNPGNNDQNHTPIFTGASGKFMPPPPPLFGPWKWYNNADGVFFWIETDKSDAYLKTALEKLDAEYDECEVDFLDASPSGTNADMALTTDEADAKCPSGSLCFRVHMITRSGSVFYGDELAASCGI